MTISPVAEPALTMLADRLPTSGDQSGQAGWLGMPQRRSLAANLPNTFVHGAFRRVNGQAGARLCREDRMPADICSAAMIPRSARCPLWHRFP